MKTLHLVLKAKWYDMIASGEKKEEYREIKPYWKKRLIDCKGLSAYYEACYQEIMERRLIRRQIRPPKDICHSFPRGYTHVRFSRGYSNKHTMTFEVNDIYTGKGRPEWGAPENEEVFIIKLGDRI